MSGWRLMQGDTLVGELHAEGCDMPWFRYRFAAGPGWERVRELFERLETTPSGPDPEPKLRAAVAVQAEELRLVAVGFDEPDLAVWRGGTCLLIDGDAARLRCSVPGGL
ncbi:hypothetical protein ACFYUY_39655 [Kitasatospora sp. NPDC004745]|uniref:hypothetical protein n=1 Tax=Kitasatospora sp. NPDC004745 TaxID=3364019 RepID=UPI003689CF33